MKICVIGTGYVGLGAGAHSYFEEKRYNNVNDIIDYIKRISNNEEIMENPKRIFKNFFDNHKIIKP